MKLIEYEELTTPEGKSPIFYVDLTAEIKERINSKKYTTHTVKEVVVKGTLEEIKSSDQTKKQFIKRLFKHDSGVKKKVSNFDLAKIKIVDIEIIRGLGYGVKSE